jgi:hypothetical protein
MHRSIQTILDRRAPEAPVKTADELLGEVSAKIAQAKHTLRLWYPEARDVIALLDEADAMIFPSLRG